jgi:hypothetical protein
VNEAGRPFTPAQAQELLDLAPGRVWLWQKGPGGKGQARSLNAVLGLLRALDRWDCWIHWEESWYATAPFLARALEVMAGQPEVTQLQLTRDLAMTGPDFVHWGDSPHWVRYTPQGGVQFMQVEVTPAHLAKIARRETWPVYSLRPSANRIRFYQQHDDLLFDERPDAWPLVFEFAFGLEWMRRGGVKAWLPDRPRELLR